MFSQERDTVLSLGEISIKYTPELVYNVEYENSNFKVYFNKQEILKLLDTLKTDEYVLCDIKSLKTIVKNSKDSLYFKDFYWYYKDSLTKLNSEIINRLIQNDSILLVQTSFQNIVFNLLLKGNMRIFDKQLKYFLKTDKIVRVKKIHGDNYNYKIEEKLLVRDKLLLIISTAYISAHPVPIEEIKKFELEEEIHFINSQPNNK